MDASTDPTSPADLSVGNVQAANLSDTEFERELRVRLAEAETMATRAEAEGEHDLADAMRSHADDLRRTAVLHALPTQAGESDDALEATA